MNLESKSFKEVQGEIINVINWVCQQWNNKFLRIVKNYYSVLDLNRISNVSIRRLRIKK